MEEILRTHIADIVFLIFIIIAVLSGYLSGGFRELLKLLCLTASFFLFMLDSVEMIILDAVGVTLFNGVKIIGFIVVYFVLYLIIKWSLHGIISVRDGFFGSMNRTLGVTAGLLKSFLVILFLVSILNFLWSPRRRVLLELRPYFKTSVIYHTADTVLKAF